MNAGLLTYLVLVFAQDGSTEPSALSQGEVEGWEDYQVSQADLEEVEGAENAADLLVVMDQVIADRGDEISKEQLETALELREIAAYRLAEGIDSVRNLSSEAAFPESNFKQIKSLRDQTGRIVAMASPSTDRVVTRIRVPKGYKLSYVTYTEYKTSNAPEWHPYQFGQNLEMRNHVFRVKTSGGAEPAECIMNLTIWDDPTIYELQC